MKENDDQIWMLQNAIIGINIMHSSNLQMAIKQYQYNLSKTSSFLISSYNIILLATI
jgi:hypothetical protein